jgi:prepilin peptidase CpaA
LFLAYVKIMISTQIIPALAVGVALCAAISDVRTRRIPNRLTYPAVLAGLLCQGVIHGWRGLLQSAIGGLIFGGVFMLFYLVRAMGAGDVKLATALGCIVGSGATVQVMFATALAGGVLAVFFMIVSGRVIGTLRNTLRVAGFHALHGLQTHPTLNLDNPTAVRMPYGLAFAIGTLCWAVLLHIGR